MRQTLARSFAMAAGVVGLSLISSGVAAAQTEVNLEIDNDDVIACAIHDDDTDLAVINLNTNINVCGNALDLF